MTTTSVEKITPMPGWALCRSIVPRSKTSTGLFLARDMETGKTTEGVAEVLAVTPPRPNEDGVVPPVPFKAGDKILIRDFLKFANQIGDMVGADRSDRVFLLNIQDALAVVEGKGILGYYDEFELE